MCVSQQQQTGGGLGKQATHRTDSGTQFGISRLSPAQTAPWPGTSSLLGSGKQALTVTCAFRTLREPRGLGRSREGRRAQTAHSAKRNQQGGAGSGSHAPGRLAGQNSALRAALALKHPPANAGGMGSVPDTGGSHMRRRNCKSVCP